MKRRNPARPVAAGNWCAGCGKGLLASWVLLTGLSDGRAQQEGPASGAPPESAARQTVDDAEALRQELQRLVERANGGDSKAALELADRVLASGHLDAASLLYRKAAEADEVEAQEKLALLLLNTDNPALWPKGHSWLDKAVQAGSVTAMEEQAVILLNGTHGRERSVPEAVKLLKQARKLPGASKAHFLLGNLAARGVGMARDGAIALIGLHQLYRAGGLVERDLEEAERLGRQAAEQGSAEAAYEMGLFHEQFRREEPDWKEAARWLETASERGHGGASTRLASYHMNGKLGEPDPERSIELCRRAAEQGDGEACFLLGRFYQEGRHLPRDLVASTAWLRIGAERGHTRSQNEYGLRLVAGLGANRDPAEGARWLLQAGRKGMPAARLNLGELLLNGVGVERNPPEALRLIEAAAKADHAGAQARLAGLQRSGAATGAPDPVGAAYWAERAARLDSTHSDLAEDLWDALTEDQQGELQRRLEAAGIRKTGGR